MNKTEFLTAVRHSLRGLSAADIKGHIDFLSEMIDDRIEEGMSEAEAVAAMGTPEEVAAGIIAETPVTSLMCECVRPSGGRATWRTVLLLLTSPIWASLLFAVVITLFTLIVVLLPIALVFFVLTVLFYPIYKGSWVTARWLLYATAQGFKRLLLFFNR